ncbi:MAG: CCA tRNA nucleotidyltransferase [Anaerolineae bacterium]|nr:CCA tRNA nucleotidyltransferase [Anaerolineae bacterium]
MSLTLSEPRRPFEWPRLVHKIAENAPDNQRLYLVGGIVRDALCGYPIHDYDLATPDNGLTVARHLADRLGGAYFPIDPERRTGRVIISNEDRTKKIIDVASFRGETLLEDLEGRDFTINAMAVRLDQPELIIDPLGGQQDLFNNKVLRQCSETSIASDPIRALRAVRQSLQFGLRMHPDTKHAARSASGSLIDSRGNLNQAERVRDEFVKMLAGAHPDSSLRLLDVLGLLQPVCPYDVPGKATFDSQLATVASLNKLIAIIGQKRDDNTAANLIMGVSVMILDRHRRQLQEYLSQTFADDRSIRALLVLGTLSPQGGIEPGETWGDQLRLSNSEARIISALARTRPHLNQYQPLSALEIHRYYRDCGETGIGGVLLMLARYLAGQPVGELDPVEWGKLVDEVASPVLDAFFRRYQQIVAPPPLLDGREITKHLDIKPGPVVGALLTGLIEAQAVGEVKTKKQALRIIERLYEENQSN